MRLSTMILTALVSVGAVPARSEAAPVRFAIVGLVHDHARGFIPTASSRQDIQLVAIVESNQELAARYAKDYKLNTNIFYASLDEMLDKADAQAVAAFTSTFDHRRVVEACAARGVHVMMEKPLAVSREHARAAVRNTFGTNAKNITIHSRLWQSAKRRFTSSAVQN